MQYIKGLLRSSLSHSHPKLKHKHGSLLLKKNRSCALLLINPSKLTKNCQTTMGSETKSTHLVHLTYGIRVFLLARLSITFFHYPENKGKIPFTQKKPGNYSLPTGNFKNYPGILEVRGILVGSSLG